MTDEELIEELSEMGRHHCRAHLPMGETLRQASDRLKALTAENEALKKSGQALLNAKHKEAAEAKLWFEKGQALTAENERLRLFIAYTAECCEDAHIVAKAFEALEKQP